MSLFLLSVEGKPVVHCHIPKTGGTSIRSDRQLSKYRLYDPDPEGVDLPSFAVLRDPYDRDVSCWKDFTYLRPQTNMAFEPWLWRMSRLIDTELADNPQTMVHHAAAQTHPVHGLAHAKTIILYDKLQEGWDKFCDYLGVARQVLPRRRDSSKYPDPMRTPSIESLIGEMYAADYDCIASYAN